MNEDAPINSAGDGSQIALPPTHVIVGKKNRSKYKKNNAKYDGRTKAGRKLVSRIMSGRNKKMSEESKKITEAATETERAQKQIAQQKKLGRQKGLQKKRDEAKNKMQSKTKEMDTLMKARLSDFKKKASDQTKKLKKESVEVDVLDTAVALVDKKVGDEQGFADIAVGDKTMKLDTYSAKRVTDVYGNLDPANQIKFRQMLNFSPETYLKAVDFAVKN
tara:strand:+ start:2100 stop:2756 length:657 start_codon:yes stop_codon:yes gene_type:complete